MDEFEIFLSFYSIPLIDSIFCPDQTDEYYSGILKLLDTLLLSKIEPETKKQILKEEYIFSNGVLYGKTLNYISGTDEAVYGKPRYVFFYRKRKYTFKTSYIGFFFST